MSEKSTNRRVEFGILADAIDAYCAKHGRTFSEVVREAAARQIGAAKLLADLQKRGRPRKTEAG